MRYKMIFSYDGTLFSGYQVQPKKRTVQEELEKAATYINAKKNTSIISSGRTDKGVHAKNQVAHFDLDITITDYKLKRAFNSLLPEDIHVIYVEKVSPSFHARYMAASKEYVYTMNIGEYNPIERNYIYQYNREIDIDKMKEAISFFQGTHDFRAFISSEDKRENTTRKITVADIIVNNNIIKFKFIANGFMKYQVRNMVGVLLEIGENKKNIEDIKKLLLRKDRKIAIKTAPPEGLCLMAVNYDN
ncbi:MAG: tRNA pseudouridine(38-40) synthase TruA [Bacilli bacterium]|nr:tRNA pseudouridine(38-40) synthase TruA [Bacilli bacterium]